MINFTDQACRERTNSSETITPRGQSRSHGTPIIDFTTMTSTHLPATSTPIKDESHSLRLFNSTPTRCTHIREGSIPAEDAAVQILTPNTRRRKLDKDGVVEQPQEEFGLEVIQSTRQQLKQIESCLLSQERVWQAKRREREREAAEAKRLADAKRAKKERRTLRETEKANRGKSRRRGTSPNGHGAVARPAIRAASHASNTEQVRSEQVQNAARIQYPASAKLMSGQVQIEARNGITLSSEIQQREQAASGTVTVAHALGRDAQGTGKALKLSVTPSVRKVIESPNSNKAEAGPKTPPQAHDVACPTFKRPITTSSAGLSTADKFRIQTRLNNNGSSRGATAPNSTKYSRSRIWVYPPFRRQVIMNHHRWPCVCDCLHPYFLQARWFEPELDAFPGCKAEFLAHAEQIVNCDAHSKQLRNYCRIILEKEVPPRSVGTQIRFR